MKKIIKAIKKLRPGAMWHLNAPYDYSGIHWFDETQTKPTKKEVDDEVAKREEEWEATQYQRDRANEYPNLAEQLDMLWHAIDAGTLNKTSDFYKAIKAVKDANPKSE
jgi:hypothetical protein